MAEQIYEDGAVITADGKMFECVSVAYTEVDGEKQDFVYGFQLKSELDAKREAAKALLETDNSPEAVAEAPAPGELNQPEAPKEETHYVK